MQHFLGQRILWQRVRDFISTYRPYLVTIIGSDGRVVAAAAAQAVMHNTHRVRMAHVEKTAAVTATDIACEILGVTERWQAGSWWRLLSRSWLTELDSEEPTAIITQLPLEQPGLIDWVAPRLVPHVVLVTGLSAAPSEYFPSARDRLHEAAASVVTLPASAHLILNADDALAMHLATQTKAVVHTYGRSTAADVQLRRVVRRAQGYAIEVKILDRVEEYHLPHIISDRQLMSVVAALALAPILKIAPEQVRRHLPAIVPPPGYGNIVSGVRRSIIIDHAAEVTPEGVRDFLTTLAAVPGQRRIAIVGDIAQLGVASRRIHETIGMAAAQAAHVVIAVGEEMRHAGAVAMRSGVDVHHFQQAADVGKWLIDFLQPDDVVLVAGGREMQLGSIVRRLAA